MTSVRNSRARSLAVVLVAFVVATSLGACGSAGSSASSSPALAWTASPAAPQWTNLQPVKPVAGASFDASYDQVFAGVAYSDGFVLVGRTRNEQGRWRGGMWSSVDGEAWARIGANDAQFDDVHLWNVATDGKRLVALGLAAAGGDDPRRGPYIALVSDDGVTWVRHDLEATELSGVYVDGTVGSPTGFLAWGQQDDLHTRLLRSTDGLAWELVDYPDRAEANIRSVAPLGPGFVAVGQRYTDEIIPHAPSQPARAWWSPDGLEWIKTDVPGGFAMQGVYPAAGGVYAVAGNECSHCVDPRATWGSPDGRHWQSLGDEGNHGSFLASNGSTIAAFAWQDDRSVAISSDGLLWTKLAVVPAAEYDSGLIVGRNGVLLLRARTPLDENGVQEVHAEVLFLRGS